MPNTIYVDRTTVVTTPSVQDFNDATYGRLGHVFWGGNAGGTADAITITTSPAPSALAAGQVYRCRITAPNTTAVTVNANALGVKPLVLRGGGALVANVLQVNDIIEFVYDLTGDQYQLIAARPGSNYDITVLNSVTSAPLLVNAPGLQTLPAVVSGSVFRKNCIMNGAMRLAQRGTSFAAFAGGYTLDRWRYDKSGAMVHTITQDADVPTVAQAGVLIPYSYRLTLTTPDTAIGATEFCTIRQLIEGHNFQVIAQRPFTVSFWVKATATGIYSIALQNSVGDRAYVANFTINTTATWEFKVINVLASPSAGTWNYTNGTGLMFAVCLALGVNYHTSAGSWQSASYFGTSSNGNGCNTGATDFRITALQVEPGMVATEFEMLDIQAVYAHAQRYYWKSFPYATAPVQNCGSVSGAITYRVTNATAVGTGAAVWFPAPLRSASPTITYYNPSAANANWRNVALAADSGAAATGNSGDEMLFINNPQVAGDAVAQTMCVHAAVDAEL